MPDDALLQIGETVVVDTFAEAFGMCGTRVVITGPRKLILKN